MWLRRHAQRVVGWCIPPSRCRAAGHPPFRRCGGGCGEGGSSIATAESHLCWRHTVFGLLSQTIRSFGVHQHVYLYPASLQSRVGVSYLLMCRGGGVGRQVASCRPPPFVLPALMQDEQSRELGTAHLLCVAVRGVLRKKHDVLSKCQYQHPPVATHVLITQPEPLNALFLHMLFGGSWDVRLFALCRSYYSFYVILTNFDLCLGNTQT